MNRNVRPIDSVLEAIGQTSLGWLASLPSREAPAVPVRHECALAGIVTRNDVLRHVAGIR